jgi:hypothetical protein
LLASAFNRRRCRKRDDPAKPFEPGRPPSKQSHVYIASLAVSNLVSPSWVRCSDGATDQRHMPTLHTRSVIAGDVTGGGAQCSGFGTLLRHKHKA